MKTFVSKKRYLNLLFVAVLAIILLRISPLSAGEVRLTADNLGYDPRTEEITARGNVYLIRDGMDLKGDYGIGAVSGKTFKVSGNVVGFMEKENLRVACDSLTWASGSAQQVIEAFGKVRIERRKDRISAGYVRWQVGKTDNYLAKEGVVITLPSYKLDAAEAARDGDIIWAKDVKRYEDPSQGLVLSAAAVNGKINGDEIRALEAKGGVRALIRGAKGDTITVTGDNAVYSLERGTIVVSGNARALQEGRSVTAESLVMHLDTRRIEALGHPEIIFIMKDKEE